ncbi:transcription termination factor Rho [Corynebacterium uberis]|uniref:transcription termination factor Rho n=1 Tax=Corynebacterium TaxID=1716 RepID=UPI001D0BDAEB|nr:MULTISPECIES: transcription termination factor Rho [Corynebacterium]MCZ9309043.1 transcription termination factor Rho [Corynebacterium sp. c6VSa_13]UDL74723.1 transcription termination factor Rho [Corynebacterium uberis]UDL76932.1 transcription termination factor Rho [Corynebacterium uberis]UDL79143.1 transcription termination factor Rho [Corynebacterium uberis]UDL81347.1 transcription termination factor Rho [Corynebacterium uberis]
MGGSEQSSLATLRIPELRKLAADRGLKGVSGLRKGELIAAIEGRGARAPQPESTAGAAPHEPAQPREDHREDRPREEHRAQQSQPEGDRAEASESSRDNRDNRDSRDNQDHQDGQDGHYESRSAARRARRNRARAQQRGGDHRGGDQQNDGQGDSHREGGRGGRSDNRSQDRGDRGDRNDRNDRGDRGDRRGRRNRRGRRGRDRDFDNRDNNRDNGRENYRDSGAEERPEELQQVAGILDVVDANVAFVRTTGYHAASSDVFVPNQLIRRCGLRSGDAVVGQVRPGQLQTRGHGRNKQKYNNLLRVESINGLPVEEARNRPDFSKLTPLYPNKRLRLETEPKILTTRVIDLIMPIGKGQRALIVSPPKAGKTTILQNIANAISRNNPECYLMVVLVDERPEEVTDMQRSVNGEVIASTFDRPPSEHTAVAELAIERAKRLVEQGKDVVVLLDSITRLGRAYNNSSPASGRILSGGVDSNALYPPKRFLGAARNIENGGSLTIIATAMVETGSAGDTVIFEEFKGTGNAELKLDRKISERRVFPAVDVGPSGTRKDELLLAPEEARLVHKLRRILAALDNQQAIDLLIKQLKKTKSNGEFLMQVASSAPMAADKDDEEDYS